MLKFSDTLRQQIHRQARRTAEPTEAQAEAGNYKKGKIKLHGMDISIENPKGSVRSGTSKSGKKWQSVLKSHYGYIRGMRKSAATKIANSDGAPYRERAEVFGLHPSGQVYGGVWDHDQTFAVPGGGIDPGEDILAGATREFGEETGLPLTNARHSGLDPITHEWSDAHRATRPPDRQHFRGTRTHFVLGDLPEVLQPQSDKLDHWGAQQRQLYAIADALKLMEGKTPSAPTVFAGRLKLLQQLANQKQAAVSYGQTADGDHLDCFVGPHPEVELVYVVDQVNPESGAWDEHKVMLAFRSLAEAKQGYLENYAGGWQGLKAITPLTIQQFKLWLEEGDLTKPLHKQTFEIKTAGVGTIMRGPGYIRIQMP